MDKCEQCGEKIASEGHSGRFVAGGHGMKPVQPGESVCECNEPTKEKSGNPSWPKYLEPKEAIKRIKEIMKEKGFFVKQTFNNQPYESDNPDSLNLVYESGVWLFESAEQVESAIKQGLYLLITQNP